MDNINIIPLSEEKPIESKKLPEPNQTSNNQNNTDTIKELPTWNIEPPIEIKRGN